MYQAIVTTYKGPSDSRGSRVLVSSSAGRMSVGWDDALSPSENHAAAARAFARKQEWSGQWHGGGTRTGFVFVCSSSDPEFASSAPDFVVEVVSR